LEKGDDVAQIFIAELDATAWAKLGTEPPRK
jgi:hypothetical protein